MPAQVMSNSPSRTPPTNASHSVAVNTSSGPGRSLESRTATLPSTNATSTQPLAPERELLRQSAEDGSTMRLPSPGPPTAASQPGRQSRQSSTHALRLRRQSAYYRIAAQMSLSHLQARRKEMHPRAASWQVGAICATLSASCSSCCAFGTLLCGAFSLCDLCDVSLYRRRRTELSDR